MPMRACWTADDCAVIVTNPRMAQPQLSIPLGALARHRLWLDALSGLEYPVEGDALLFQPLAAASAHILIPVRE